jgi:hypothetical protein
MVSAKRISILGCLGLAAGMAAFGANPTSPFTQCPGVGADPTGCQLLIVVTAVNGAGAATAFNVFQSTTDLGPFDGSEDTLIGVLNSSGSTLKTVTVSGPVGSGVFLFDLDGACISGLYTPQPTAAQCPGGAYQTTDPGDYGSVNASFTAISGSGDSGTVVVGGANGLANNGTAWFDLEGTITAQQLGGGGTPTTPAPKSLILVLMGLAAAILYYMVRNSRTRMA